MDNSVSEPTDLDQAITHLAQAISSLERVERINRRLTDDAKDAARYRWLREGDKKYGPHTWQMRLCHGNVLDAAIDKAMEAENAKTRK